MRVFRSGLAAIVAASLGLGCGSPEPELNDRPIDVKSPSMEAMKADMLKNMQKTASGRRAVKDVAAPAK